MNTFNLLGDIVQDDSQKWFEGDIVPAMVIGWLAKQDGDVEININSLGGSVTGGLAIANAIKGYGKGKVTANILGVAASMASVVACAADEIKMGKGAFMMVHNPWTIAMGDANDIRKEAEVLDKMKDAIIGFYQSKFSIPAMELAKLMDDETWIEDKDCELYGLAASPLEEGIRAAAKCDTRLMFAHAPGAAAAYYAHKDAAPAPAPADPPPKSPAPTDWEARFKGLQAAKDKELAEMSAKYKADLTAMKERHDAALAEAQAAHKAELDTISQKCADAEKALAEAKANAEQLAARCATAEKDLASKGEQLDRLNKAHALLTGGVLSPGEGTDPETEYQNALSAAKSPEQREAIRKARCAKAKK